MLLFYLIENYNMHKLFIFIFIAFLISRMVDSTVQEQDGSCICAIMNGDTVDAPVLEQKFNIAFSCDEVGKLACRNLCVSLAEASKTSGSGSFLLCEHTEEDVEIYVSVFSKVCDFPYAHSGLAYANHLCCKDRKPEACQIE